MRYVFLVNMSRRLFTYEKGNELTGAHIGSELGGTPSLQSCEVIFRIFNTDERPAAYCGPSMSVGDVLVFPEFNAVFGVSGLGFQRIDIDAATLLLNAKPIPAEWRKR